MQCTNMAEKSEACGDDDVHKLLNLADEIVACPACLELVYVLRKIPCGHIFCENCLGRLHRNSLSQIQCPIDQRLHTLPRPDINKLPAHKLSDEIRSVLQRFIKEAQRAQAKHGNRSPSPIRENACTEPYHEGGERPVEHYCASCISSLCAECAMLKQCGEEMKHHKTQALHPQNKKVVCIPTGAKEAAARKMKEVVSAVPQDGPRRSKKTMIKLDQAPIEVTVGSGDNKRVDKELSALLREQVLQMATASPVELLRAQMSESLLDSPKMKFPEPPKPERILGLKGSRKPEIPFSPKAAYVLFTESIKDRRRVAWGKATYYVIDSKAHFVAEYDYDTQRKVRHYWDKKSPGNIDCICSSRITGILITHSKPQGKRLIQVYDKSHSCDHPIRSWTPRGKDANGHVIAMDMTQQERIIVLHKGNRNLDQVCVYTVDGDKTHEITYPPIHTYVGLEATADGFLLLKRSKTEALVDHLELSSDPYWERRQPIAEGGTLSFLCQRNDYQYVVSQYTTPTEVNDIVRININTGQLLSIEE